MCALAQHRLWLTSDGKSGERANFRNASLKGMNLRDRKLCGAIFDFADLAGANLSGADLRGASFRNADLSDATLVNANLVNADLTNACFARTSVRGITWLTLPFPKTLPELFKLAAREAGQLHKIFRILLTAKPDGQTPEQRNLPRRPESTTVLIAGRLAGHIGNILAPLANTRPVRALGAVARSCWTPTRS